ncbi:MipA/OmpV family protein [Aeromonas enteropelogenes]|uniref:MipA/OmpV family protein n=1 Tax=Aeromonas enteropelogenes TaxID=29489 RepID=UPI003987B8B8
MPPVPALRHASLGALLALLLSAPARADLDLGALSAFSSDSPSSPIPKGLVVGGAFIAGQARYQHQDDTLLPIPGALYFGDNLMYLGDRARYYLTRDGGFSTYAFGRMRFGNLDPDDDAFLHGLNKRKGEFEAGFGADLITPYALWTMRATTDVTGNSNGQEVMLWANFPIIRGPLLLMPGAGVMLRSHNLANYYFGGVSQEEARAGRQAWNTGTTLSPMVSVIGSYRFNANWIGGFGVNYERYDDDIADSPIVQHKGELYAGFGLGYIW